MANPLVSILMPFKNTENYLEDCLASILKQDYQNWELIAVNDHSTDASLEIVKDFCQKDSRIRVEENKGAGIISALRLAYLRSSGMYITRMDSDDIMQAEKISGLLHPLIEKGPGYISIGQVKYFSDSGISNGYARYETWLNGLTQKGLNFNEIYKECVIPSPCWMVHKTDLERCGAFHPNRYPEDYDLTFRFYHKGMKCLPNEKVLHLWRDYGTRTSRTSAHYAQNYFLDIKLHYFLKLDYDKRRPLVLWGAGYKGKTLAKGLKKKGIAFTWLCDNPKKIGKSIYGIPLVQFQRLEEISNPQSIITVANELAQRDIRSYFRSIELNKPGDVFFFC